MRQKFKRRQPRFRVWITLQPPMPLDLPPRGIKFLTRGLLRMHNREMKVDSVKNGLGAHSDGIWAAASAMSDLQFASFSSKAPLSQSFGAIGKSDFVDALPL